MLKLRKYLKPFAVSILAIVVLLFAQAMCELTMPDYMSNIVNVGINSNGVENGVLKAVRESEYDKLALFMDQDQKQVFADNYDLVTTKQADEELLQRYPALKQENIYILKDTLVNTNEEIKLALSQTETCVSGVEQEQDKLTAAMSDASAAAALSDEEKKMLAVLQQMPQGSTLFDVVAFMPSQQLDALKDQMNTLGDAMGQSSVDTANAQYVVKEYEAIGIDTDAIQYQYLFLNGALMLLLALGSAACAVAVGFLASRIAAGLGKNLRHDVFRKVESFSLVEFGRFSTNTLLTRTTNDIQQIQMVLVMILRMVIYAPIIGIGALFKVLTSDVSMTWIIALVIIIILGIMGTAFLVVLPKFRVTQKLMDHLNAVVREFLDGMPVIRAFNNQKIEEKKFDEANRNIMKNLLFVGRSMGLLMPLIMLVMNCTSILIVWVGAHRIGEGVMQVGDMMAFMQYSMQIIMAFMMITMLSIMIPRASVAAGRIDEVLKSEIASWDIKITANDLSEAVLTAARRGVYNEYALRTTPPEIIRTYFTKEGTTYKINQPLKRLVSFGQINLSDRDQLRRVEKSQIVFCRNVIIYFDDEMKRKVIGAFYDNLEPNGMLLIGHSESLHNISRAFKPEHHTGTIVYRKLG